MSDTRPTQDRSPAKAPGLAGHSPEDALSSEPIRPDSSSATARLLARFVRASRSAAYSGGGDDGWSYSSGESADPAQGRQSTYRPRPDLFGRAAPTALTAADFRSLAMGEEDHHLMGRVRDQQLSTRVLALGQILLRATILVADRTDLSAQVESVRSLLVRADRADSEDVATVLLHPSVGRWMSRTLRELEALTDESAGSPPEDLIHLHSIAAAAAIRAGLTFDSLLPLRDGFAFLPTLGAAYLGSGGAGSATVYGDHGSATIKNRHTTVRVPANDETAAPFWHPAHRVRAPVGSRFFDFILDDMDPYRDAGSPAAPSRLSQAELTHWEQATRNAGSLLASVDSRQAEALAVTLKALTPLPGTTGGTVNSATSTDAFGGLTASVPLDGVDLAATLVHEFQHIKFNALQDRVEFHRDGNDGLYELFYAPWRDDPRPLSGLFHGVFAFIGVVEFWRKLALISSGERLRRAQFQLTYWSTQTREAYVELCSSRRLTDAGEYCRGLMGRTVATWADTAPVPEDVAMLAAEAVVAHRMRWRLHHLRPDAAAVAELADAWASGTPHCHGRHVPVSLCPDRDVTPSDAKTALLCKVATAPSELVRTSATSLAAPPGGNGLDPADLARLCGLLDQACQLSCDQVTRWPERHETWIRLGLVLRRVGTTVLPTETIGTEAAAGALTHRPEVVRAVYMLITTATGAPPDPVGLAAWIGAEDGAAPLSDFPQMYKVR